MNSASSAASIARRRCPHCNRAATISREDSAAEGTRRYPGQTRSTTIGSPNECAAAVMSHTLGGGYDSFRSSEQCFGEESVDLGAQRADCRPVPAEVDGVGQQHGPPAARRVDREAGAGEPGVQHGGGPPAAGEDVAAVPPAHPAQPAAAAEPVG